jgi:hypothetical protein
MMFGSDFDTVNCEKCGVEYDYMMAGSTNLLCVACNAKPTEVMENGKAKE